MYQTVVVKTTPIKTVSLLSRTEFRKLTVYLANIMAKLDNLEKGQRELREQMAQASGYQQQPGFRRLISAEDFKVLDDLLGRNTAARVAMVRSS